MGDTPPLAHQDDEFWELVAKYRRGKRGQMLERIESTARNSTELADLLELSSNTTGCYLREAKRDGLVTCVTPDADRYKMYALTEEGQEVVDEL